MASRRRFQAHGILRQRKHYVAVAKTQDCYLAVQIHITKQAGHNFSWKAILAHRLLTERFQRRYEQLESVRYVSAQEKRQRILQLGTVSEAKLHEEQFSCAPAIFSYNIPKTDLIDHILLLS